MEWNAVQTNVQKGVVYHYIDAIPLMKLLLGIYLIESSDKSTFFVCLQHVQK